jgi:hypothetical protein
MWQIFKEGNQAGNTGLKGPWVLLPFCKGIVNGGARSRRRLLQKAIGFVKCSTL